VKSHWSYGYKKAKRHQHNINIISSFLRVTAVVWLADAVYHLALLFFSSSVSTTHR
jgi:hypothetical protein